jgi:hypothetical protein
MQSIIDSVDSEALRPSDSPAPPRGPHSRGGGESDEPSDTTWVGASREAQGLPPKVIDPATLDRVAALLVEAKERRVAVENRGAA